VVPAYEPARACLGVRPASSRRERKRRTVRDNVLGAAEGLFTAHGFEGTRMEAIASAADVAVGTVYNYFPAKSDLLLAVLLADVDDVLAAVRAIVARNDPNARATIEEAVRVLLAAIDRRPRALWRQVASRALVEPRLGHAYLDASKRLHGILMELLVQRSSLAGSDCGDQYGAIVFSIVNSLVLTYFLDATMTSETFSRELRHQLTSLFGS